MTGRNGPQRKGTQVRSVVWGEDPGLGRNAWKSGASLDPLSSVGWFVKRRWEGGEKLLSLMQ